MHRYIGLGVIVIGLSLAIASADSGQGIRPGDSREQVVAVLGQPQGSMRVRDEETLLYPRGEVILRRGVVTSLNLMSDRALEEKTQRRQKAEEETALHAAQQEAPAPSTITASPEPDSTETDTAAPASLPVAPPDSPAHWSFTETFRHRDGNKRINAGSGLLLWPADDCIYQATAKKFSDGSVMATIPLTLRWKTVGQVPQAAQIMCYYRGTGTVVNAIRGKGFALDPSRQRTRTDKAVVESFYILGEKSISLDGAGSGERDETIQVDDITGELDVLLFAVARQYGLPAEVWLQKPISKLLHIKVNIAEAP